VAHAVAFARAVNAGQLVLFHHDPLHSDGELEALEAQAKELWADESRPPQLARDGMQLELHARLASW
jgi:ribonuclease BN (tRNA processing enzyme)